MVAVLSDWLVIQKSYWWLYKSLQVNIMSSAKVKSLKKGSDSKKENPSKKAKTEHVSTTTPSPTLHVEFLEELQDARKSCSESVIQFKFNKKRVRVLSEVVDIPKWSKGVVYWMSRDQRVQDNWAFLYAQHLALKVESPLRVCFCLVPKFLDATIRHYRFMLKGLQEVAEECEALDIHFHLLFGEARSVLPDFVKMHQIGGVVTDFAPLRVPMKWVDDVKGKLPNDVPFCQVDAHNIVPCWVTSDKQEYAARTIRRKIHDKLKDFLTEFPPVVKHPYHSDDKHQAIEWDKVESHIEVNMDVGEVNWAVPGTKAGLSELHEFCLKRLKHFEDFRNDPTKDHLSNLSPWVHFGQISVQRCILTVLKYKSKYSKSVDAYVEEAVIRRELSDNFCFHNPLYDQVEGAQAWAKKTLEDHAKDKREYIYTRDELENSKTHDVLWNAAQRQMVREGKMHGFLRMYWAKKILEWTKSPEEALNIAIFLNDKYELDGRDPNGYVGCMWSICGIHDQGWTERPVFGKIRYMNFKGCQRKFDVNQFVTKYKEK